MLFQAKKKLLVLRRQVNSLERRCAALMHERRILHEEIRKLKDELSKSTD